MTKKTILDNIHKIAHNPILMFASRFGDKKDNTIATLELLTKEDKVTAGRISDYLDIKPSSVTQIIKKLEKMKSVKRIKSEEDARVTYVKITEIGKKFLETKLLLKTDVFESIFKNFSTEEVEQLNTLLAKLGANLNDKKLKKDLEANISLDGRFNPYLNMRHSYKDIEKQMEENEALYERMQEWRNK